VVRDRGPGRRTGGGRPAGALPHRALGPAPGRSPVTADVLLAEQSRAVAAASGEPGAPGRRVAVRRRLRRPGRAGAVQRALLVRGAFGFWPSTTGLIVI